MAVLISGTLSWPFLCTEHPRPRCLLDWLLQRCSNVTTEMRPTPQAKFNIVNCVPPIAPCFSISHSALTPQHTFYFITFITCAFLLESGRASRERAQGASSCFVRREHLVQLKLALNLLCSWWQPYTSVCLSLSSSPLKHWDYRVYVHTSFYVMLRIEPRCSYRIREYFTNWATSPVLGCPFSLCTEISQASPALLGTR